LGGLLTKTINQTDPVEGFDIPFRATRQGLIHTLTEGWCPVLFDNGEHHGQRDRSAGASSGDAQ
jgi:hypothetical protein